MNPFEIRYAVFLFDDEEILDDEIRFLVNGVRQIGDVETNGPNFFDDESFQAEWG